eukprot:11192988-Lingulodinium_polyedra.AAC.1
MSARVQMLSFDVAEGLKATLAQLSSLTVQAQQNATATENKFTTCEERFGTHEMEIKVLREEVKTIVAPQ